MEIEIITNSFQLDIYGFGGVAINKDYVGTAFKLSGKMWEVIKSNGLKNKGLNIWVYDANESVFAGVELDNIPSNDIGLEQKVILLKKYAYYKHIGSYKLLKQVGANMIREIKGKGFETELPYIEIYGHWTNDETKLETELLMRLK